MFTSGDRERSLGKGITNWIYTNNRFDLQSKIHATQSDLCLAADFKHEPVGGHLPLWRGDTRFHLEPLRTAPIFSFFV